MSNGFFVTFEGPEGSGKSTQVQKLARELSIRSIPCLFTREPGGTSIADRIRSILLSNSTKELSSRAELLMLEAARADHVDKVIKPALKEGKLVICDRFTDSSVAYQGGGRGIDEDFIASLNEFATGGLEPKLTLIFDIEPEEGLRRAGRQGALQLDRLESEALDFHRRVRSSYIRLAQNRPDRYYLIDASCSVDEVAQKVLSTILARWE